MPNSNQGLTDIIMAGTITTIRWCAVKDGLAYEGSFLDIVHKVCEFWFDEKLTLIVKPKFSHPQSYYSYSDEWTTIDMHKDAARFIARRLMPQWGYRFYRQIR